MAFTIPSMSESHEFLAALFKFLFPSRDAGSRRSYHGKRITFLAGAITQLHAHIDAVMRDLMPDTAGDGTPIRRWGKIFGVIERAATGSTGTLALRVYGDAGGVQPADSFLTHVASGKTYRMPTLATIPAGGYIDRTVVAEDTGSITNLEVNQVLEFSAPVANIRTRAIVVLKLTGGYDDEAFGSYRTRVLDTIGKPAAGGTVSDYVKWALEVAGIANAYAYSNRSGLGTVDVVGLKAGLGAARILSAPERASLLAALKLKAPAHLAGTGGALRVLTVIDDPQNVDVRITTNGQASNAFDWDDVAGYTVLAWTPGTRVLQFAGGALPPTLAAKHRITVKGVATVQTGQQYVVEAVTGADTVLLETIPTVAFAATDIVYAGGPLVDPIRDAIIAHMSGETVFLANGSIPTGASDLTSTVGLEELAAPIGPANPAGVYGTWSGGIIRAIIGHIAVSKSGVRNYSIVTPAADYEATDYAYPLSDQIGQVSPASVIVRSA